MPNEKYRIPDLDPTEVNHSLLASFRQMKSLGMALPVTKSAAAYIHPMPEDDLLIIEVSEKDVTHIAYFKSSRVLWVNQNGDWKKLFQKGEIYFWTSKFNESLQRIRGYPWKPSEIPAG